MARSILATTSLLILAALLLIPAAYGQTTSPVQDPGKIEPEKLKQLSEQLDRTIDQYITWLTQTYQMNSDQQQQVRIRLQEVKQEHLQYGSKAAAEMVPLQQELRFHIEKARKGEPIDKETMKELQKRLVAVVENAPLTFNNVIVQAEKILPDEQVQAGRERQKEFKDRQKEVQDRTRHQAPPAHSDIDVLRPYMELASPQSGSTQPVTVSREPAVATQPDKPIVVEVIPLDDWAKYVEEFIARYKLDGKQVQQCQQILKELRKRADEYRLGHKEDYKAAEQVKDMPVRNEQISQLDKPILEMFTELKTRLDNIPTDSQRKLAEAAAPASQPSKGVATRSVVPAKAPTSAPASGPAKAGEFSH